MTAKEAKAKALALGFKEYRSSVGWHHLRDLNLHESKHVSYALVLRPYPALECEDARMICRWPLRKGKFDGLGL